MTEFINTRPTSKGQKTAGSGIKKGTKHKKQLYVITPDDVELLDGVKFVTGRQVYQFKARPQPSKTMSKVQLMGL
jgi:hypothetical protein